MVMPKCQREWKIRRVGNEDDYTQQLKGKQELLLTKILRLSKLKIKKKMLGHWLKCLLLKNLISMLVIENETEIG